ncbi:hypothetical protein M422DRAFT_49617 [Sphaerobolus stellatus SS14]|uniref:Uncharacterized protein n=1 Tax=Sphaerobolus stellatus (strain SS14) TaxID=990650 RepID=A0A0C9VDJ8_SPHS4|nr:hypothetical protein M422DRAFT_49617 [Sphaerobolus stellatus SS14]
MRTNVLEDAVGGLLSLYEAVDSPCRYRQTSQPLSSLPRFNTHTHDTGPLLELLLKRLHTLISWMICHILYPTTMLDRGQSYGELTQTILMDPAASGDQLGIIRKVTELEPPLPHTMREKRDVPSSFNLKLKVYMKYAVFLTSTRLTWSDETFYRVYSLDSGQLIQTVPVGTLAGQRHYFQNGE